VRANRKRGKKVPEDEGWTVLRNVWYQVTTLHGATTQKIMNSSSPP